MERSYSREAIVGLLVILGVAGFVGGSMWLTGKTFGAPNERHVQFTDVSGIKVGSPVWISGYAVGKVTHIVFRKPGDIDVSISLPRELVPMTDAAATIAQASLVGDFVVTFDPGTSGTPLPDGTAIRGTLLPGLQARGRELADRADSALLGAQTILSVQTAEEFHAMAKQLNITLKATQRLMEAYSDPSRGPAAELTATAKQFRLLAVRLDSTLANPALARTLQRSDTLTQNLSNMTRQLTVTGARLDTLLAGVQRGEGTIGKFARDTAFYSNTAHLMGSLDSLVRELQKHPGKIGVTVKLF